MADAYKYYIVYHYPNGSTTSVLLSDTHLVKVAPNDYASATVPSKFQLFNSYGQNSTSQYSGSTFTIYRHYTGWTRSTTGEGTRLAPSSTITKSNTYWMMADTLQYECHLYPYIASKYATGTFNNGPYENTNITITGKANYDGGTDVSVKSSLSRQYVASKWTTFCGTTLSGGITPGTTQTIQLAGVSYTEGNTIVVTGLISHITAWTTYSSSKAISALPALAERPDSHTYHNVNLQYQEKSGLRKETLSVDTQHVYTFSHWATDAAGTTAADTSYKPTSNTTVYAVWKEATGVQTTLPVWTTTDYVEDADSLVGNTDVLFCDPRYDNAWYSTTIHECMSYPLKHVGWTLNGGTYIYPCGTSILAAAGGVYTAVFEMDRSGLPISSYYPPNYIEHPAPEAYPGHEYLGLSTIGFGDPDSKDQESLVNYIPGENISVGDFIDCGEVWLFQVWKNVIPDGLVRIYNSTTNKFEKYKPIIYNSATKKWESYIPKIYNGTDWDDIYS